MCCRGRNINLGRSLWGKASSAMSSGGNDGFGTDMPSNSNSIAPAMAKTKERAAAVGHVAAGPRRVTSAIMFLLRQSVQRAQCSRRTSGSAKILWLGSPGHAKC